MKKWFVFFVLAFWVWGGLVGCQDPCETLSLTCDYCQNAGDKDSCKLTAAVSNTQSCATLLEDFYKRKVCVAPANTNNNQNNVNTNANSNHTNTNSNNNQDNVNTNTNSNGNQNNTNNNTNSNGNQNNVNTNTNGNQNNTNNNTNDNKNRTEEELDKEACRLMVDGPFEERGVSATTLNAPILQANLTKVYRVRFPKAGSGFVKFVLRQKVLLLLYAKPFVVMEMLDTEGKQIKATKEELLITACTDIKRKLSYRLSPGSYFFKIGPSAATFEVALVVNTKQ